MTGQTGKEKIARRSERIDNILAGRDRKWMTEWVVCPRCKEKNYVDSQCPRCHGAGGWDIIKRR